MVSVNEPVGWGQGMKSDIYITRPVGEFAVLRCSVMSVVMLRISMAALTGTLD